jgi:hypothetical protein
VNDQSENLAICAVCHEQVAHKCAAQHAHMRTRSEQLRGERERSSVPIYSALTPPACARSRPDPEVSVNA